MKRKVRWTEQALSRLAEIEDYIALSDPVAAAGVIDRLFTAAERLQRFPASGRSIPELAGAPLREVIEDNYRIVYRAREGAIEIITVFDGHRRIPEDDLPRVKKR